MLAFASINFIEAKPSASNEADSLKSSKNSPVQLAFRKVAQKDLLGSISVVDVQELTKKNYNTYSLDNMQGYVGGWNGASLWGMDSYLVLIDGVPRDANNIDPTEIDKITFLKGAAASALYGSRGAKGVVMITSKRGQIGDNKIEVRANTGLYATKTYPKYLGSSEYMTLYNEARTNDGLSSQYTSEDIYNFSTSSNKYRYPNIDFYSDENLKKTYNRSEVIAELSGGNARSQYYANVGYYTQDDLFKVGQGKNNNTNRLNVRGNVDFQLTDFIKAYVNANATFYNSRTNKGNYWSGASTLRPNRLNPLIPISYIDKNDVNSMTYVNNSLFLIDNKYILGGLQSDLTNVYADMYAGGYSQWTSRQFQFDTGFDVDLKGVLKGLSFKTMFAIDYATAYTQSYDNTYAIYVPTWSNYNGVDVINNLTKYSTDKKSGTQNISNPSDRITTTFSAQFDYVTSINKVHNISASLIASGYQLTQSDYHKPTNANVGLLLGYNYQNKYYADFAASIPHSAKLPVANRDRISPSLTLGWNLAKEGFLQNSTVVNDLSLSASGSILNTDLDIDKYYLYTDNLTQNSDWFGWYDGSGDRAVIMTRSANKNLSYAQRKEFSANIKAGLFNNLITVDASYFTNRYEGVVVQALNQFPSYFASGNSNLVPYINFNNTDRNGFDVSLNFNKKIGQVAVSLGLNATYYQTLASRYDELQNNPTNLLRTGKAYDGLWGLKCLGYYNSTEIAAIDGSPAHPKPAFGDVKSGDLKYLDVTGDGVIDAKDEVLLGRNGAYGNPLVFGANLTLKYKNFTLFALATGGSGSYAMKSSSYFWVYGEGKYSEVVRGRWTPATASTATFPRLTTQSGANNFRNSDYWMYSTDRLNISKVQLTYDFPAKMFKGSFIHNISAYVSGSDLLTISKEQKILEMFTQSGAPQTRFYNLGLKVTF